MKKGWLVIIAGLLLSLFSTQFVLAYTPHEDENLVVNEPLVQQDTPKDVCVYNPVTADILSQTTESSWTEWIKALSGAKVVSVGGSRTLITTRSTYSMFNGATNARAYPFVREQVAGMYQANVQLVDHTYYSNWKNLILTIPGEVNPDEIVIFSAHLDSTSNNDTKLAPGAEDNASGSAALLEAARIFRQYRFDRTVRIIWFTGEEQGLYGSSYYTEQYPMEPIVGVVNLDMFGYDADNDRCFELHVGTLPESQVVGQCFGNSIDHYNLDLTYDYLTTLGEGYSDHAPFWDVGVGAVEVLENYSNQGSGYGCGSTQDRNPHYHRTTDTIDKMNLPVGFAISQAGMGTAVDLAGALGPCFETAPEVSVRSGIGKVVVSWAAVPDADLYQVYRASGDCDSNFVLLGETTATRWDDLNTTSGQPYAYKVQAVSTERPGGCFSAESQCLTAVGNNQSGFFLPVITR